MAVFWQDWEGEVLPDEEVIVQGGTDRLRPAAGGEGYRF